MNYRINRGPRQYLVAVSTILLLVGGFYPFSDIVGYRMIALVLLAAVSVLAILLDIIPVVLAATLSAFAWNFFFIPPKFTFHISGSEDLLLFLMYFFIALINGILTYRIRSAEQRANEQEERARTLNLYDTVLHSLSHELRTPIATILGAVDTLQHRHAQLTETQRSALLAEIDAASLRLNRQVEHLLQMSRVDSGTLQLLSDWTDINELLTGLVRKTSLIAPGHRMVYHPNEGLPYYKVDVALLEQSVFNILHNALQYTPPGTVVNIQVNETERGFRLSITDTGPGIPKESRDRVFEKFYRLPGTPSGGTGLGLSIARGFVEAMGGTLSLEDSAEQGARFTLDVPAAATYLQQLKHD